MRQDIAESPQGAMQSFYVDPAVDIPVVESLSPLIVSSPVVDGPVRSVTTNNRSLCYMQSGLVDQPQLHVPLSRGAVSGASLGSADLLQYIDPLPMDQLLYHEVQAMRAWPESARSERPADLDGGLAQPFITMFLYYLSLYRLLRFVLVIIFISCHYDPFTNL